MHLSPPCLRREPVSCFTEDSIYAVCPPQADRDTRDVFESHVLTGQGQVRALCREDMLMYREYVKNRYMWQTADMNWIFCTVPLWVSKMVSWCPGTHSYLKILHQLASTSSNVYYFSYKKTFPNDNNGSWAIEILDYTFLFLFFLI